MNINAVIALVMSVVSCWTLAKETVEAGVPWQADVSLTLGNNDNLARAELKRDTVDDQFVNIALGIGQALKLNPAQNFSYRAFVQREQWHKVTKLSKTSAGGQLSTDWIPFISDAPISYEFNVSLSFDKFGVKQRDSTVFASQFIASKPIGNRFQASLGIEYKDNDSDGSVWDLHHVRGFVTGVYVFRPRWLVRGTYSYIDGLIWSSAQTRFSNGAVAGDIFDLVSASEAIEPDQAFNDAYCGGCEWHAYQLEATTHVVEIGVSGELGHNVDVNFSLLAIDVTTNGDNDYGINVVRAGLSKRF